MIVLNLKTYPEVTVNNRSVTLASICQEVYDQYHIPIVLCVQATDIYKVVQVTSLPIYAQHIDTVEPGKHTGFITSLAVKECGAQGVMINHSEHRIGLEAIKTTIEVAKNEGLQTLVCIENADEGHNINQYLPDMIALEDPVLIGGAESIVHNEAGKQKVIEFINAGLQAKLLVGAGVKGKDDIKESLQLGASGVLLASGITLAPDPKAVLIDLCEGFK